MITLPPEYQEIHEDAHIRCNVVDGKAADFVSMRAWSDWQNRTHEMIVYRHRLTGNYVSTAREIPVLTSKTCCP